AHTGSSRSSSKRRLGGAEPPAAHVDTSRRWRSDHPPSELERGRRNCDVRSIFAAVLIVTSRLLINARDLCRRPDRDKSTLFGGIPTRTRIRKEQSEVVRAVQTLDLRRRLH